MAVRSGRRSSSTRGSRSTGGEVHRIITVDPDEARSAPPAPPVNLRDSALCDALARSPPSLTRISTAAQRPEHLMCLRLRASVEIGLQRDATEKPYDRWFSTDQSIGLRVTRTVQVVR